MNLHPPREEQPEAWAAREALERDAAPEDSPLLESIEQPGIQDVLLRFPRVVSNQRGER